MFHPYDVRPIGTPQFEAYLVDLMTSLEYERQERREAILPLPVRTRKEPEGRRYDPVDEGWRALMAVIQGMAVRDYLEEYRKRLEAEERDDLAHAMVHESRCLEMENEYFRETEEGSTLLDCILREIIHDPRFHGNIHYRILNIKQAERRLNILF